MGAEKPVARGLLRVHYRRLTEASFDELMHPRNRVGKWRDKPGASGVTEKIAAGAAALSRQDEQRLGIKREPTLDAIQKAMKEGLDIAPGWQLLDPADVAVEGLPRAKWAVQKGKRRIVAAREVEEPGSPWGVYETIGGEQGDFSHSLTKAGALADINRRMREKP